MRAYMHKPLPLRFARTLTVQCSSSEASICPEGQGAVRRVGQCDPRCRRLCLGALSTERYRGWTSTMSSTMIPFTDDYQDRSSEYGYQFEFDCERCGNGYSSSFQKSVAGAVACCGRRVASWPGRSDAARRPSSRWRRWRAGRVEMPRCKRRSRRCGRASTSVIAAATRQRLARSSARSADRRWRANVEVRYQPRPGETLILGHS